MFKIVETTATIASINPRAENHGEEHALTCDIKLQFVFGNKHLALLDEKLLPLLYQQEEHEDPGEGQDTLDLEENALPHLRFPLLGALSWNYSGAGYTFHLIDERLNGDHIIEVEDCKVNKFKIDCEEGGTINLSMMVQGNPTEETVGELCGYIKEKVRVSLIPPEKPGQVGLLEDDDPEGEQEAA